MFMLITKLVVLTSVVTMVANKLQRQWFALVLDTNCIRQPKGAAAKFTLQPQYTDSHQNIRIESLYKYTQSCSWGGDHQMFEGFQCIVDLAAAPWVALCK